MLRCIEIVGACWGRCIEIVGACWGGGGGAVADGGGGGASVRRFQRAAVVRMLVRNLEKVRFFM